MEFTQIWYPQAVSHQDLKRSFFMTVDPENAVFLSFSSFLKDGLNIRNCWTVVAVRQIISNLFQKSGENSKGRLRIKL